MRSSRIVGVWRPRLGATLAVLLAGALNLWEPASASAVSKASTAVTSTLAPIPVWDAEYMTQATSISYADAMAQAKSFRWIAAGNSHIYTPYVSDMKAIRPGLKILMYVGATAVGVSKTFPEDYYAHDSAGNRIQLRDWAVYQMEPSSPGWRSYVASQCASLIASSGYDGCFLDQLGPAPLNISYVTGVPINPATGVEYTTTQWLAQTSALAASVRSSLSPKPVIANGLTGGQAYFDPIAPTSQLVSGLTGGMAELWLRGPTTPLTTYGTEASWKKSVDMLTDAANHNKVVVTTTKVWLSGTTQAQMDAWHEYALGSFLLGEMPGRSFFEFMWTGTSQITGHPWWTTRIGNPLAGYTRYSSGVYERDFEGGKVFVNPTTATAPSIALGKTYATLQGATVNSITLAPHTAKVLIG